MKLLEINAGKTFPIAGMEFIKVKDTDKGCYVLSKEIVFKSSYGDNNNFAESKILKRLNKEILPEVEKTIGAENVLEFKTDLTSLDGLKTYGDMTSKISLPTFDIYRENVKIFDEHKLDDWFWLATPDTTPEHYNDWWALCVSPLGIIINDGRNYNCGVRPVLLFASDIFVS